VQTARLSVYTIKKTYTA